jgi:hypothetical protein
MVGSTFREAFRVALWAGVVVRGLTLGLTPVFCATWS